MTKILIVEDNSDYAEEMAAFLIDLEHDVSIARSAGDMWDALCHDAVKVVVLDLGLPDADGFDVIPRMRQLYPQIGLLVLTGRVALDSRILGLRLGADHYLTKPIKFLELAAHIEALERRVGAPPTGSGPWTLASSARTLALMGLSIALTEKEFSFLHLLTINTRPVSRDVIVAGLGDNDPDAGRRIDMLAYRLRKKVRTGLGQDLPLRSAYGEGYSLSTCFTLC
ncbi:MAG: two-component system OmpR family response regulator [Janthinobacterium sp.]|jgi:two-component system OmpR family response regulator